MMSNITNTTTYTVSIFHLRTTFTAFCFIKVYHYTTAAYETGIICRYIWNVRYLKMSILRNDVMLNPTILFKDNTIILPVRII